MGDKDSHMGVAGPSDEEEYGVGPREKEPVYVPGCEEEEDEEEPEEGKHSCLFLRVILSLFFPDRQPLLWLAIHLLIILIYAIFNFNGYTISLIPKLEGANYTTNTIWSMALILGGNFALYLSTMVIRCILVKGVFHYLCSRNAYLFALMSMLDPHIFYVMWASIQSIVWQILITHPTRDPKIYCINIPLWSDTTSQYLTFGDESLLWISCTIYIHIILSLRCLAISIISFIFELNLLVNSNDALKKYLKLYINIRKFNLDWLTSVMANAELIDRLKPIFANSRLRCKLFPTFEIKSHKNVEFKSKHGLQVLNEFHDANYIQYFSGIDGISAPSEATDSLLEQSSTSYFTNWLLIHYVIRVPPVVSLIHQELLLKEDSIVSDAGELLFEHMYLTLTKLMKAEGNAALNGSENPQDNNIAQPDNSQPTDVQQAGIKRRNVTRPISFSLPAAENIERQSQDVGRVTRHAHAMNHGRSTLRNHRLISVVNLKHFRSAVVDSENTDQPVDSSASVLTADYQFNHDKGDDTRYLSVEQLQRFLLPEESDTIMGLLDLSGHGRINLSILQQALLNLYSTRKKFKNNVKGQDSIFKVLSRLVSAASWLVAIVSMSFLAGITAEAVVVSGAALLSAITVALSYLYTNFMTSVIFVAFSNPYSVGDRVRLNDGEPLTVKKIRTYTTEFVTILGKAMVYQNAMLSTMKITNESRAARATIEINFKVDATTSEEHIYLIEEHLKAFCNLRQNDFVKDSTWLFLTEFNPGHCYKVSCWFTCIESWSNWQRIFQLRGELMEFIMRECKKLGVGYSLPVQPLLFPQTLAIRNIRKKTPSTPDMPPETNRKQL